MSSTCLTVIDVIYKFASVVTLIFLTWQIREAKKANNLTNKQFQDKKEEDNIRHQKDERQKAIELAELYANELIGNISYLSNVYRKCGISQHFQEVPYKDFRNFDIYELKRFIMGKTSIEDLRKIIKNIDLTILLDSATSLSKKGRGRQLSVEKIEILSLKRYIENYEEVNKANEEVAATSQIASEKQHNKEIRYHEAKMKYATHEICYKEEFNLITVDTLNKLEYFCMYFNSGVADEETVYQSLHQSFLEMIKVIYFRIASRNETGKDKYYTNIIKLYNEWSKRYSECLDKEIENNRNNTHEQDGIKK